MPACSVRPYVTFPFFGCLCTKHRALRSVAQAITLHCEKGFLFYRVFYSSRFSQTCLLARAWKVRCWFVLAGVVTHALVWRELVTLPFPYYAVMKVGRFVYVTRERNKMVECFPMCECQQNSICSILLIYGCVLLISFNSIISVFCSESREAGLCWLQPWLGRNVLVAESHYAACKEGTFAWMHRGRF